MNLFVKKIYLIIIIKDIIYHSDCCGIYPVLTSSTLPVPAEEINPEDLHLKVTKKIPKKPFFNEKPKTKLPFSQVKTRP